MNEPLLHLIALWSGCFLSRHHAMFVFMVKHEGEFSEEYEANLRHIKSFFNGSRVNGFKT